MASLLEQAQIAAAQHHWTAVGLILQQFLAEENEYPEEDQAMSPAASPNPSVPGGPMQPMPSALALHLVVQTLTFGDFQARWDVAKLLPTFGDRAVPPLIALLQDERADREARWYAARSLSHFAHPTAIQALIAAIQSDDDDDLSRMAAASLANLGSRAIAAIAPLLSSTSTRSLAVTGLSQIRNTETIAPLLSVVQDADAVVRAAALEALSSFHDGRVPPVLVQALADPDPGVRSVALIGLGFRGDLSESLDLVHLIGDRLTDPDLKVCQQAAIALGRLGATAIPVLLQAVQSVQTPAALQLDLVRALAWSQTSEGLEALAQLLGDRAITSHPSTLLSEIFSLLGRWSVPALQPRATEILLQALQEQMGASQPDLALLQTLVLALGELGQPAAQFTLVQLLATDNLRLRLHIIAALKRLQLDPHSLKQYAATATPTLQQGIALALQAW